MKFLKSFVSILALSLLSATIAKAQVQPDSIISTENVTIEDITQIFEQSFYKIVDKQEHFIKIKDSYTIFVDLAKKKNFITYSVYWSANESFSNEDRYKLLNKISNEVLVVTPSFNESGKTLTLKTDIWLEGGVTAKNLVMTEKIFVKALNLVLKKDTERIIK